MKKSEYNKCVDDLRSLKRQLLKVKYSKEYTEIRDQFFVYTNFNKIEGILDEMIRLIG